MVYTPVYNSGANAFTRDFLRKLACYGQKVPEYELASVPANDATNWATNNIDQFFAWVYGGDANTGELYSRFTQRNSPTQKSLVFLIPMKMTIGQWA
jgi:hypothetical protein